MEKENLKIAMLCAEYPPRSGPGPTRMAAFAKGLAAKAYDPVIFTTQRVPGKFAECWYRLDGTVHNGDKLAGTHVGRGRTQSLLEKVVNFIVPMEPRWTLSLSNLRRSFKSFAEEERPDLIFTTSNPLASAVGGMLLKHRFKIPLIIEFRDPWTQNPMRIWPTYIHYLVESWLERRVLRTADAVIMNTPTARSNLLAKYNWLDENKVHVISHGFDGDAVESANNGVEIDSKKRSGHLSIAYAGGFYLGSSAAWSGFGGIIRSILGKIKPKIACNIQRRSERVGGSTPETILRAVAEYNADKAEEMPRVEMHFIGTGADQLQNYISSMGLEGDVFIYPRVTNDDVRHTLQRHDLLYLTNPTLPDSPFVGTKTFDYIAAGRPIIAELGDGDQARIILAAKAGWVIPPGAHQAIVDIFSKIAGGADGPNGLNTPNLNYIALFERKHQIDDLVKVIDQVVGNKPRLPVLSQGYREITENRKNKAN